MSSNSPGSSLFNSAQFNSALFGGSGQTGGLQPREVGSGILYPALRKAAVTLGPGRTPSPAQFQDAIDELNRLVGSLNCDRLNIYSIATYKFPLTGAKSYTMGQDPSGVTVADFDGPWPIAINRANIIYSSPEIRRPLAILTDLQWARIRVQDIPNTIPYALYNDRAYPLANLYLYPQPVPGYILELYIWQLVPQFLTITDAVLLPPGYEDALVLNLAVRLVTQFSNNSNVPRQVDPNLYEQARLALMRIESINAPRPTLDLGCGCKSGYMNVYSGEIY
jgi:hypothetical protein